MHYDCCMNWSQMITDISARGVTLRQIAELCDFASAGAVKNLHTGMQKTCAWERGDKLIKLHRRVMRRKVRA